MRHNGALDDGFASQALGLFVLARSLEGDVSAKGLDHQGVVGHVFSRGRWRLAEE